jgi:hypothetical protein
MRLVTMGDQGSLPGVPQLRRYFAGTVGRDLSDTENTNLEMAISNGYLLTMLK